VATAVAAAAAVVVVAVVFGRVPANKPRSKEAERRHMKP
jgi:hypothetical protein